MTVVDSASPDLLVSLAAALTGTLSRPGEPGYERSVPWNVAVPVDPVAVVAAATADDVAATVRAAREAGLRVAVQATGHGAVRIGPDTILVLTGDLDELTIDPDTRVARLGAGVRWQQVLDAGAPSGSAPLCGSSPNTGVTGFLTGGGIGPVARTYGVSSSRVRAFDLVTGDGTLRRVTPDSDADLFRGLCGGKSTLGIVTAVETELLPIAEFYAGALYYDGRHAAAVLEAWRVWSATLTEEHNTSLAFLQLPPLPGVPEPLAGKFVVAVRFASVAEPGIAADVLAPMRAAAPTVIDTVTTIPYAAVGSVHADPVDPMPTREATTMLRVFDEEAAATVLVMTGPASSSPQVIVELRLLGGALGRPGPHPDVYCHREAAYSLLCIGVLAPPVADAVIAHGEAVVEALAPWSTGGSLPNFAASDDPAHLARVYDEDTRAWLGALAEQHDPAGIFRVGQVVRLG
ncbi:FAD-binding oxidoreductase [Rhodococcus sp. BP-332]|uniref:FAD-binding oxidoreductase n=1 Tax=Rhodococcus sp. BP-332 TaxID=2739447 RepID=UPI001C9A4223|nr:FAD-binding oxidoreductase [Rhodococcus sp. BP-332]MBY6675447.1 FAD-binding oxidoreductase [Rhodococcus sp. BP-332]